MARNVHNLIDDLHKGLDEIKAHFSRVESFLSVFSQGPAPRRRSPKAARRKRSKSAVKAKPAKRKTRNISPKVRAMRKFQGQYMGMIRRLPKAKQAQVKKVRETKGYPAALKLMKG